MPELQSNQRIIQKILNRCFVITKMIGDAYQVNKDKIIMKREFMKCENEHSEQESCSDCAEVPDYLQEEHNNT